MYKLLDNLSHQNDMEKVSAVFQLLKKTTNEVAEEANNTHKYIKTQLPDTVYRFFSVIDSVNDIILIKDNNNRWITLNKFGQNLYNLCKKDYYKKTNTEIAEAFPHLRDMLSYGTMTDEKTWNSKSQYREIELFVDEKKHIKYFDTIKTPIYLNNNKKELIIIGRDITEIKESDFKYKAFSNALNAASDNIFIIDKHGIVIMCNNAVIKTFGFTTHACIEGHPISIIGSEDTPRAIFKDLWTTINSNNIWTGIIINKHVDGSSITCKVTAIPIMNGLPEPIYFICSMKVVK